MEGKSLVGGLDPREGRQPAITVSAQMGVKSWLDAFRHQEGLRNRQCLAEGSSWQSDAQRQVLRVGLSGLEPDPSQKLGPAPAVTDRGRQGTAYAPRSDRVGFRAGNQAKQKCREHQELGQRGGLPACPLQLGEGPADSLAHQRLDIEPNGIVPSPIL